MWVSLGKKEKMLQLPLKKHFPAARRGGMDSREQRADSVSSGRRYLGGPERDIPSTPTTTTSPAGLQSFLSENVARDCLGPLVSDHTAAAPLGTRSAASQLGRNKQDTKHFFFCSFVSQCFFTFCLFEFLLPCCCFHEVQTLTPSIQKKSFLTQYSGVCLSFNWLVGDWC